MKFAVENDGKPSADITGGHLSKGLGSPAVEFEVHHGVSVSVETHRGILEMGAGEQCRLPHQQRFPTGRIRGLYMFVSFGKMTLTLHFGTFGHKLELQMGCFGDDA